MKIQHRDQTLDLDDIENETISQLALRCASHISADVTRITLFILPKPGLLKHPFPDTLLTSILTPKSRIKLVGTPDAEAKQISDMSLQSLATRPRSNIRSAAPAKRRDWRKVREEAQFTFHAIEPLNYLPNPDKSRRFLERLANDPGIKASMRKHEFSVGLLTEMNPIEHTTSSMEGTTRTLGLNRNRGEVIELRLRTDAYDGYRDYKVIRKTLCHELSHNVWGDHDRNFWDLTKQIEQEVERNDTLHGGHRLVNEEFYDPGDSYEDGDHIDGGGWTGGDFVLGKSKDAASDEGLSRREIMARAAMSRRTKEAEAKEAEKRETEDGK